MVEYALNLSYDELPDQAIHQLKRRLIDTLGGALAAYTAPTVRIGRQIALTVGPDQGARIWGSLIRTSPDMAAFVMVARCDISISMTPIAPSTGAIHLTTWAASWR